MVDKRMVPAKYETPIEIKVPLPSVIDLGLELVHDFTGVERNFLHEVSFEDGDQVAEEFLVANGYKHHLCGHVGYLHRTTKRQMWIVSKEFPVSIRSWGLMVAK